MDVFLFLPSHPCHLFGLTARLHHSLKVSRHTLSVLTTLPTFFMRGISMARTAPWPASQSLESSPPKVFFNFTSHLVLVTPRNHISFRTQNFEFSLWSTFMGLLLWFFLVLWTFYFMSTLKSYPHFYNHPGTKPQFISWIVSALQIFSVPWPLPSAHCLAHLVNSSHGGTHMFLPSPPHHENSWNLCKKKSQILTTVFALKITAVIPTGALGWGTGLMRVFPFTVECPSPHPEMTIP